MRLATSTTETLTDLTTDLVMANNNMFMSLFAFGIGMMFAIGPVEFLLCFIAA